MPDKYIKIKNWNECYLFFFFLLSRSVCQLQVSSGIECATLTVPNAVEGAAWYAGDAESNGH